MIYKLPNVSDWFIASPPIIEEKIACVCWKSICVTEWWDKIIFHALSGAAHLVFYTVCTYIITPNCGRIV